MIVTDFGTVGNGIQNDTAAIQRAIDSSPGSIVFPPGRYLTGTLRLRDNLTIVLMNGAALIASPDLNDYVEDHRVNPASGLRHYLFEGRNISNFTLCGDGEIRGNGPAYWDIHPDPNVKMKLARPQRIVLVHLVDCHNVSIRNIAIHDAPAYTIWLLGCRDVTINGVRVRNQRFGPNTDVLDIDCCANVAISNCNIEAGDDCIAIKSDTARLGRNAVCENICVSNCILSSTTTGVRIGYEGDGVIRNCVFNNLTIHDTRTGLDILSLVPECAFTRIARGTPVENIIFSNIVMRDVRRAIHVWAGMSYTGIPYGGYVKGITFSNIRASSVRETVFIGSVGRNTCVSDILLRDIYLEHITNDYTGDGKIADYPVNCWGTGNLPWSLNLRKIDNLKLENVNISRGKNLPAEYGRFNWTYITNGSMNGISMDNSGKMK